MATAFKPTVVLNSLNKYKESLSSDHVYWKNFDVRILILDFLLESVLLSLIQAMIFRYSDEIPVKTQFLK